MADQHAARCTCRPGLPAPVVLDDRLCARCGRPPEGAQAQPSPLPEGGIVTLTVRIGGVGPWGVEQLTQKYAHDLLRNSFVRGVRINDGPGAALMPSQGARRVVVDEPGARKVQERIKRRDLTKLRGLVGYLKGKVDDRDAEIERLKLLVGLYVAECDPATVLRVEQAYQRIQNGGAL